MDCRKMHLQIVRKHKNFIGNTSKFDYLRYWSHGELLVMSNWWGRLEAELTGVVKVELLVAFKLQMTVVIKVELTVVVEVEYAIVADGAMGTARRSVDFTRRASFQSNWDSVHCHLNQALQLFFSLLLTNLGWAPTSSRSDFFQCELEDV